MSKIAQKAQNYTKSENDVKIFMIFVKNSIDINILMWYNVRDMKINDIFLTKII